MSSSASHIAAQTVIDANVLASFFDPQISSVGARDWKGYTPLHYFAKRSEFTQQQVSMITNVLNRNPSIVNLQNDQSGEFVLFTFVSSRKNVKGINGNHALRFLQNLLSYDKSLPTTKVRDSGTVLHVAIANEFEYRWLKALVDKFPSRLTFSTHSDAHDTKGLTALQYAINKLEILSKVATQLDSLTQMRDNEDKSMFSFRGSISEVYNKVNDLNQGDGSSNNFEASFDQLKDYLDTIHSDIITLIASANVLYSKLAMVTNENNLSAKHAIKSSRFISIQEIGKYPPSYMKNDNLLGTEKFILNEVLMHKSQIIIWSSNGESKNRFGDFAIKIRQYKFDTDEVYYKKEVSFNGQLNMLVSGGVFDNEFEQMRESYVVLPLYSTSMKYKTKKTMEDYTILQRRSDMNDMVSSLQFVHDNAIVHGNLKLNHFLFDGAGIKLIDFSMSMRVGEIIQSEFCPLHTPPEMIMENKSELFIANQAIDAYQIGCCFVDILPHFSSVKLEATISSVEIWAENANFHQNGFDFDQILDLLRWLLHESLSERAKNAKDIKDHVFFHGKKRHQIMVVTLLQHMKPFKIVDFNVAYNNDDQKLKSRLVDILMDTCRFILQPPGTFISQTMLKLCQTN